MNAWKRLDERLSAGRGRTLWQFVKFNLVSLTVTILQLLLANLLPLAFDRVVSPLPPLLRRRTTVSPPAMNASDSLESTWLRTMEAMKLPASLAVQHRSAVSTTGV